ncbi:MAG TPA: hypothetical protein VGJ12_00950 [Gemmatimonadaceae bacterium]
MFATSKLALMMATLTAAIVSASASAGAQDDASVTVTRVPINTGTFTKFMKASSSFASYVKQHPAEAENIGDSSYDNSEAAAKAICGPRPGVQKAIESAGLSCSQWVGLTVELNKAGSAAAMVKAGQKVPAELGVPSADIAFYNAHTADITLALQEIGAATGSQ